MTNLEKRIYAMVKDGLSVSTIVRRIGDKGVTAQTVNALICGMNLNVPIVTTTDDQAHDAAIRRHRIEDHQAKIHSAELDFTL